MKWEFEPLANLSDRTIETLRTALESARLASDVNRLAIRQILGNQTDSVWPVLERLRENGFSPGQIAILLGAVQSRTRAEQPGPACELVLSGPAVEGVLTSDTLASFNMLVEEASARIVLAGYAVHDGKTVFRRLAERMEEAPELEVVMCLDVPRKLTDASLDEEIVRRFAMDFRKYHWPWQRMPQFFYHRRSLMPDPRERASLHAKCVIIDRRAALITSANFTHAAQSRNIEAGILTSDPDAAARLDNYFSGLIKDRQLLSFRLPTDG